MTEKEFEQDDPFELVGTAFPSSDNKHLEEMAETFIVEYFRMGWPEEMILGLFKTPFHRGPFTAYKVLGEECLKRMITKVKASLEAGGN